MLLLVNHYLVLFHNYFWPRPRPHSPCLGLVALASALRFWPRLTSLNHCATFLRSSESVVNVYEISSYDRAARLVYH